MHRRTPTFGLLFFFVFPFLSFGTEKLTLSRVIDEALKKNPEILAAEDRWKAERAKVAQARWWPDPQVGIGYERIPEGSYSSGEAAMRMYTVSQTVPFPGKLTLRGRMAGKVADLARERYVATINEVVSKVKSAYYSLFFIYRAIEINRENKELIQKFARIAQTKYAVGEASQHDVLKAQVELSLIVDDLVALEHEELPTAEARLNGLLDRPVGSSLGVPEEFEVPKLVYAEEEMETLAVRGRPELEALRLEVEKSGYALTLARMEYLPDLMLKLTQKEMEMTGGAETNRGVTVSFNLPLWFWKQNSGIEEKASWKAAAESSYQAMRNRVLFEVRKAVADFKTTGRRTELFRTSIIPQAEQALKAARVAYETGKVDFLTLLNSERGLRDARLRYYRVLAQHATNLAELERVVGASLSR